MEWSILKNGLALRTELDANSAVLPSVIPHTVVSHDVAAHISSKGWVGVLVGDAAVDDDPTSRDARKAKARLHLSRFVLADSPFACARAGSLLPVLRGADGPLFAAMWASAALRAYLEDAADYGAALAAAGAEFRETLSPFCDSPGTVLSFVLDAVAWLRNGPARLPLDLPRFRATALSYTEERDAALGLLAPTVTTVSMDMAALLHSLPNVHTLRSSMLRVSGLQQALQRGGNDGHLSAALDRVSCIVGLEALGATWPAAEGESEGPLLFPNLTTVSFGDDAENSELWHSVARLQRLVSIDVEVTGMSRLFDDEPGDPVATTALRDAVVGALAAVGSGLRTAAFEVSPSEAFLEVMPSVLEAVGRHCVHLRALTVAAPVPGGTLIADLPRLAHLRTLTLTELTIDEATAAAAVAIPSALPHLEVLRMYKWSGAVLPAAFIVALAASPSLVEWDAAGTALSSVGAAEASSLVAPFRRLRIAKAPIAAARPLARAPNLRCLSVTDWDDKALCGLTFASPYVRLVLSSATRLPALDVLHQLRHSGVAALACPILDGQVSDEVKVPQCERVFPATLRHLTLMLIAWSTSAPEEVCRVLTAARATTPEGSMLESLTFGRPPAFDCAEAVFGGGGFSRLRRVTLEGCEGEQWSTIKKFMPTVCSDVVIWSGISRDLCNEKLWDTQAVGC